MSDPVPSVCRTLSAWASLAVSVRSADEMEPTRLSRIRIVVGSACYADSVPAAGGSEEAYTVGDALVADDCGGGHGLSGAAGSGTRLSLQL